jgi:ADP-heptose:LPS heptosyltransferase
LTGLGLDTDAAAPVQAPSAEEAGLARELVAGLPRRFLAVHPGSGSPTKNWPADRYADLVARVSSGCPWLLVEGPADAEAARALRGIPGAVRLRETPSRVLGAVLSLAGAYVGNDSGVSHLAAAWGAPTVALFGPTDPRLWAPEAPAGKVIRGAGSRLDAISVEAVETAVARLRSGEPEHPSG